MDGVLCWTALMYATSQGYTDIVEMLIAAHADVNVTSNHPLLRDEETVLMLADRGAHDDIATLLLNAGANDERRGVYGVDAIFASYLEEWGSLEWFCWAARHGDELDKQRACRLIRWSAPEPLEDDPLKAMIWDYLGLTRIYTKRKGQQPDLAEPVVLSAIRKGTTVKALCMNVSSQMLRDFNFAM